MDEIKFLLKYARNIGRFLPTLLDNLCVFLWQKKPYRGPLGIVWNMNNYCNARCLFCDYWRIDKELPLKKNELSTKEKLIIIGKLGNAGVWQISFCNGEPLLSEDIELLMREAKRKKMLVNISTNGSLLEEKAKMLIDSGLDYITISIDSHIQEIHDGIRRFPGLFGRIERGIEAIKKLRRKKRPYITARCLVNKKNAFSLGEFVDYWDGRVDDILFNPICENPYAFFKIPAEMKFWPEDEAKFKNYYYKVLNNHKRLDNLYHREIPNYFFRNYLLKNKYFCFAGTFFAEIDCEGNLYPCRGLNRSFGNLLKEDFIDICSSEEMENFRNLLKTKLKCDDCWKDRFLNNIYIQRFLHLTDGKR